MATDKDDSKNSVLDAPAGSRTEEQFDSSSITYIDPEMEKKIVRKFDWLVLPQFVIIIVLGYDSHMLVSCAIFMRY
jgi:hypothetical protein